MCDGGTTRSGSDAAKGAVANIIIPCSSRKRLRPAPSARAVSLATAAQSDVETAWLRRIATLERPLAARDLYVGRGAVLGRQSALAAAASLYIASAGLGLVSADEPVPTYGVTVAGRGEDSISARVIGRLDPGAWWSAVCGGPMSTTLERIMAGTEGRITLVALTKPYATMLAASLASLPESVIGGLRLFGWRLHDTLPPALHGAIMGYDGRLEGVLPGTRNDYPQRALAHFVAAVLPAGGGLKQHHHGVEAALSRLQAPRLVARPRASDDEILAWLGRPAQEGEGIGRLLRRIRDEGIACEQARFARLHARAREKFRRGASL